MNQRDPQMNPFDRRADSGLYASSSSSGLPDIVQMPQANNAFGYFTFCLNQEDPHTNPLEGNEVGCYHQENQHEQQQLVTGKTVLVEFIFCPLPPGTQMQIKFLLLSWYVTYFLTPYYTCSSQFRI